MALRQPWLPPDEGRKTGTEGRFFAPLAGARDGGRETGTRGRFFAPRRVGPDEAVADILERQHAVIGLDQLVELGISESAVHKRGSIERLHRVHQTVYSPVRRSLLSREGLWMAAVLACGPHAVLSHRSAAALHELRDYGASRVDVTVPGRSRGAHPGIFIHRSTTLTDADITTLRGIPTTTVARTLLDLAAVLPRRDIERACDQAEIAETFDLIALVDQLERNPRRRGTGLLKSVLNEHEIGLTATANELEEAMLAIVRRAGLPTPEVNVMLDLGDGEDLIKVDFLWRRECLAVETDGRGSHGTAYAFESDRRRDQRLTIAGWHPLRFSRRQVFTRPREVERTLRSVYARVCDSRRPRS